jgi:hypothetical protein
VAYAQQINQGQEAQNEDNNLVEIGLSLEAKVALAYKHQTANRDKLLKKLARANAKKSKQKYKKTFVICKQAVELADTVLKKIFSGKRVLLNHKYISKITECDSRKQNVRILEQLENLLGIDYHRLAIVDGTPYNYHYSFKLNPTVVKDLKNAGAWEAETIGTFLSQPYNNRPHTSSGSKIDHRANSSQNSNSKAKNNISSVDTKKEDLAQLNTKTTIVEQQQVKSYRPANVRKKATKAQLKAKIYQLPPQFDKPKTLAELKPITQEECTILQSKSGREFTLNAQNQILQDMAKRLTRTFNSRWQFICYFADCLRYEKRDAVKCSGNNFYIKANVTEENVLHNQQEKYLEETEQISIRQPTPSHQFRAKLANTLEPNTAYNLLLAMQSTSVVKNTFVISLNRQIELTENEQDVVLAQAQAVFNSGGISENNQTIEKIQFMTGNQRLLSLIKKENNNRVSSVYNKVCSNSSNPVASSVYTDIENKSESAETCRLELPKSNWGEVCAAFISEYGYELYKHWLESLSVEQTATTIELSTSSDMVRDRIEQNYMPFLSEVAQSTGINKIILI